MYSIVETNQIALFHNHLNTIFSFIKFTKELKSEGTLSFLDVAVIRKTDGTLSTDIYRKPTYTGRYLSFTSHHPLNQNLSIARTLYSRANNIISDENKKIQEFHHVSDILKSNGFPSHKRSFSFKTNSVASQQINQQFQGFATISYVQGISESIKRILAEIGIRVAIKPHFTLSSIFRKPKDPIDFEEKRSLAYQISCRDCDAICIGETERSVKTRKRKHVSGVRNFDPEKSALCQHVLEHDHEIDWKNVKILKFEPHANKRRTAESFLINQKAKEFNVLNRNDSAILPGVYKTLLNC